MWGDRSTVSRPRIDGCNEAAWSVLPTPKPMTSTRSGASSESSGMWAAARIYRHETLLVPDIEYPFVIRTRRSPGISVTARRATSRRSGRTVIPELSRRALPTRRRMEGRDHSSPLGGDLVQVRARHADERRDDEERLGEHVPERRPAESTVQVSATNRADPDADQDRRQREREDRADTPEEDGQVTEPDDLHSHRGEAG